MTISVKPISGEEIEISYGDGLYDPIPEVIPLTNKAIVEWIEDLAGDEEIESGYFMETDYMVLNAAGHRLLGERLSRAINNHNRPHTVAFWRYHHGDAAAERLEKKYFRKGY